MRFQDLTFVEQDTGIKQALVPIGNYKVSVILEPGKTLYELAIFDDLNNFIQFPGIHPAFGEKYSSDVIPYLSPEQVSGLLLKIKTIVGVI